ncbi:MAG: hypothetical protein LKI76_04300 [Megasphaera sp.]|jgi:ethanolamine utilization microcompartment shell protein EutL|nr:hypothetical protein [Megasphaera sp.]
MNQLQKIVDANMLGQITLQVGRVSVGLIQTKTTRQVYIAVQDEEHEVRIVPFPIVVPTPDTERSIPHTDLKTIQKEGK